MLSLLFGTKNTREPAMSIVNKPNVYEPRIAAIHRARVNRASLQAEARIIRKECRRCGIQYREILYWHRVGKLRHEARIANLAYGFLRGRKYRQIEAKTYFPVNPSEIVAKLSKWGPSMSFDKAKDWLAESL